MIQLGQVAVSFISPLILAGFTFCLHRSRGRMAVALPHPPLFTAVAAFFMYFAARPTPDEAGFPGAIQDEIDNSEESPYP